MLMEDALRVGSEIFAMRRMQSSYDGTTVEVLPGEATSGGLPVGAGGADTIWRLDPSKLWGITGTEVTTPFLSTNDTARLEPVSAFARLQTHISLPLFEVTEYGLPMICST
jgi:hypothetical protein